MKASDVWTRWGRICASAWATMVVLDFVAPLDDLLTAVVVATLTSLLVALWQESVLQRKRRIGK